MLPASLSLLLHTVSQQCSQIFTHTAADSLGVGRSVMERTYMLKLPRHTKRVVE